MKNEQVVQLPLNRLTEFPEHPFKVRDDEFMDQLTDSIRSLGVINAHRSSTGGRCLADHIRSQTSTCL